MYNNYNNGYNVSPYQQPYAQNRMNQIEQQYGIYQNYQPVQQQAQQQIIKGRPVSSYDEAKASMIDLDGSLFVFPDVANKRIYTKQIMLDGSAELKTYELKEMPIIGEQKQEITDSERYVLRKDFEQAINGIQKQIKNIMKEEEYESTTDAKHDAEK